MKIWRNYLLTTLFTIVLIACDSKKETQSTLGEITFEVTGSPAAQPIFKEALLLLHSFEFDDAVKTFVKAQETDPEFVMAYWGEAMAHNHPLWSEQSYEEAIAALNRLDPDPEKRVAKAQTEIEADFIRAVNILYGEGAKLERDQAYSKYMETLFKKYEGHHEVAAFYALSLLGSIPVGRDDATFERSAVIVKAILEENPSHPGALHYLIHSYDDPYKAAQAVEAANSYMLVAKDAGHALHMPSHIYVAMGMWDQVVSSNEASWQASVDRMNRLNLDNDKQNYHGFHWLEYGYLQQGRYQRAKETLQDMARFTEELPSRRARYHLTVMKGGYIVETEQWNAFSEITIDKDGLGLLTESIVDYTNGLVAYHHQNADTLHSVINRIEKGRIAATAFIQDVGLAMCGPSRYDLPPNQLEVDQAYILEMQLRSLSAQLQNNTDEAEKWLRKASDLEANISYSYGPPDILKPTHELFGEWLLANERYDEALTMFNHSLQRAPKRIHSLQGKLEALQKLGKTTEAEEVSVELTTLLSKADKEVIAMR